MTMATYASKLWLCHFLKDWYKSGLGGEGRGCKERRCFFSYYCSFCCVLFALVLWWRTANPCPPTPLHINLPGLILLWVPWTPAFRHKWSPFIVVSFGNEAVSRCPFLFKRKKLWTWFCLPWLYTLHCARLDKFVTTSFQHMFNRKSLMHVDTYIKHSVSVPKITLVMLV